VLPLILHQGKRWRNLLFLKKKKQKDFYPFKPSFPIAFRVNGQKFFGSFFQKRTLFLPFF